MKSASGISRILMIASALFFFSKNQVHAQSDYLDYGDDSYLTTNAYVDTYYAHYTDSLTLGADQKFPFISPKSDRFGLNVAMFSGRYEGESTRGMIALHFGDLPRNLWPSQFNMIGEAHAGVKIVNKLWLDAGFFRSHFGGEKLYPRENFCSSGAFNTYFEPHYEAGVRLEYLMGYEGNWVFDLYGLNGYNTYMDNNKKKSLGSVLMYRWEGEEGKAGYANYIGDDTPSGADTISHLRVEHNLFANFPLYGFRVQLSGDYATQNNSSLKNAADKGKMYGYTINIKRSVFRQFNGYARYETFHDRHGFMPSRFIDNQGNITGYMMKGITLGLEYKPSGNSYLRVEGRQVIMDKNQKLFYWDGASSNKRNEILVNLGAYF